MCRSVLKIICIVSGILFVVLSIFTIVSVALILGTVVSAGGAGIIGGADAPTMEFLLHNVARSPVFYAAIVTLFLFAGTGLALIFGKKPKK